MLLLLWRGRQILALFIRPDDPLRVDTKRNGVSGHDSQAIAVDQRLHRHLTGGHKHMLNHAGNPQLQHRPQSLPVEPRSGGRLQRLIQPYNLSTGILNGLGNSKMPLVCLILSCLFNIVLDFVFILVLPRLHCLRGHVQPNQRPGTNQLSHSQDDERKRDYIF